MADRVLQVITDTDRRGAQVFALDLAPELERLGWAVRTVALRPGEEDLLDVPTLGPSRFGVPTLRRLRAEARRHDVVVAHGSSTLPACAIALIGTGVPFVYRQISDSLFWADTRLRRARVRLFLRRAARVVALWGGSARVLHRSFGVPDDQLDIVPNAVPGARFRPSPSYERWHARRSFGLDPDRPTVLFLGALVPEKGADVAVRAVAAHPAAQLLVVGDGPEAARVRSLARELLAGRARLVGALDDVRRAYAAADLVAFPSRGGDSMPAVLIEAGLCEVPSVATSVQAIPDIVVDGRTGWLVPVGDDVAFRTALIAALDDDTARAGRAAAARARCSASFTIGTVAPLWGRTLRAASDTGRHAGSRQARPAS